MDPQAYRIICTPISRLASGESAARKSETRQIMSDSHLDCGDPVRASIVRFADFAIMSRLSGSQTVSLWMDVTGDSPVASTTHSGSFYFAPPHLSGRNVIAVNTQWGAAITMSGHLYTRAWSSGQTWKQQGIGPDGAFRYRPSRITNDIARQLDAAYADQYARVSSRGVSPSVD